MQRTNKEHGARRRILLWAVVLAKEEEVTFATPVLPSVFNGDYPQASFGTAKPVKHFRSTKEFAGARITRKHKREINRRTKQMLVDRF